MAGSKQVTSARGHSIFGKQFLKAHLKFTVYGRKRRHTHAFCSAVTLVWGSFRLAPIIVATQMIESSGPLVNFCTRSPRRLPVLSTVRLNMDGRLSSLVLLVLSSCMLIEVRNCSLVSGTSWQYNPGFPSVLRLATLGKNL